MKMLKYFSYFCQTRMQSLSCEKQRSLNMRQVMKSMVQEEGMLRPWRGMSAMAFGAGPAHAMYFTCLEVGREKAEKLVKQVSVLLFPEETKRKTRRKKVRIRRSKEGKKALISERILSL